MNVYQLIDDFWEYSEANPGKCKSNHGHLYLYILRLANSLFWKEKFGFPTLFAMESTNIRSRHMLNKTLKDLEEFGLIKIVEESKNQHTSKIIALSNNYKAQYKANNTANNTADEHHISQRVNGTGTIKNTYNTYNTNNTKGENLGVISKKNVALINDQVEWLRKEKNYDINNVGNGELGHLTSINQKIEEKIAAAGYPVNDENIFKLFRRLINNRPDWVKIFSMASFDKLFEQIQHDIQLITDRNNRIPGVQRFVG